MSSAPPSVRIQRPRRWPLVAGIAVAAVLVLYFVLTSGAFIKAIVVPRVAAALKSDLTVGDISLSPFSSVTLTDIKLTPKGAEPLASIHTVTARYSLWSILRGTIRVDSATVDGVEVTLAEAPDGSSNLSRLVDGLGHDTKPKDASAPPNLDVHGVALRNVTLRYRKQFTNAPAMTAELANINVSLDQLANGKSGKLTLAADARAENVGNPPAGAALHLGGAFDVGVDAALLPTGLKGSLKIDLTNGTGAFRNYIGLGTSLDLDFTGKDLRDATLRFARTGEELARITVRGPLDPARKEMRLSYEVRGLDRKVLALAGAASGIDLGDTSLGATGRVDVANGGNLLASNGRITVSKFSLGRNGSRTPSVDVSVDYKVSESLADKTARTALVDKLEVLVQQDGTDLVKGGLDRPMNLAFDRAMPGFRESTFGVALVGLDLARWRALLPTNAPTGVVRADLKVTAAKDGQLIRVALDSGIDNLSGTVDGNRIQNASATLKLTGNSSEFNVFTVESLAAEVRSGRELLLSATGVADWRLSTGQGGVQFGVECQLAHMLSLHPVPSVSLKSGVAKFTGQIAKRATDVVANASASLGNITGTVGSTVLADYQATADFSVTATGTTNNPFQQIDFQRASLTAQTGFNSGGNFDFHGKFDTVRNAGTFDFKSVNVNESALGPFVAAAVAPNKLLSVSLDLSGKADIDLGGKSSAVIDLKVSNFRAEDPAHRFPATPLAAGLSIDVTQSGAVSDLRRFEIDLGATDRVPNKFTIAGHVDLSTNKPSPSTITLRSDGLDLTRYYDLFAGGSTNTAPAAAKPAPVAKSDPNAEPAPIVLPIRDLTGDIDIAHVYLREVEVGAVKGRVVAKDGRVSLDPFGLTLNGAPVTAKVVANLAVPGYEYDVNVGATGVPLAPLANSFVLDLKGLVQGTALANLNLKGAGVTGPNLRKHLAGLVLVAATNAQIRIPDKSIRLPGFLTWMPIFPNEINPGTVLALIGKKAVLAEPIRTVQTRVDIGQGVARLSETRVASPAILAEVVGTVQINDIITNSTLNLPVSVAIGGNGPLPAARTIGKAVGTIGKPDFDKDYAALAGLGLSILPGGGILGEKAANAVQGVTSQLNAKTGGILGNLVGGANAAGSATNAAPNTTGLGNALGNLLGGGAKKTNAPAAAPGTNKPINALDFLPFGRKK